MVIVNIRKQLPALELDVSFRCGRETAVIVGPSGSGKTTLLRMIAGLERPDQGRIVATGRTWFDASTNLKPEERRIGLVFQDGALFPWLNVEQNILFGVSRQADSDASLWIEKLIAELELEELLAQSPCSLSGGERQRVALARALAPRPGMLLLDEPFSALHGPLRARLRRFVREMQKAWKIPVIMVTHDVTEAFVIADRLIKMEQGRVIYEGSVDGLANQGGGQVMAAY